MSGPGDLCNNAQRSVVCSLNTWTAYIPLLEQEGWLRHQSLEWAQTGWSVTDDHPVCGFLTI